MVGDVSFPGVLGAAFNRRSEQSGACTALSVPSLEGWVGLRWFGRVSPVREIVSSAESGQGACNDSPNLMLSG